MKKLVEESWKTLKKQNSGNKNKIGKMVWGICFFYIYKVEGISKEMEKLTLTSTFI